jgi:hypothetical protein
MNFKDVPDACPNVIGGPEIFENQCSTVLQRKKSRRVNDRAKIILEERLI